MLMITQHNIKNEIEMKLFIKLRSKIITIKKSHINNENSSNNVNINVDV